MSMPLWVIETAATFWADVRAEEPFPRTLWASIGRTLPLSVVPLPNLGLVRLENWLRDQDVVCALGRPDRALRACLVCRAGTGLVVIDSSDDDDEQRYSLAHELGHYLREQWQPRQRAIDTFGVDVVDVLNGVRPPSTTETVRSLLARVPIEITVHLMERTPDGEYAAGTISRAEREADLVAYELLAPSDAVLDHIDILAPQQKAPAIRRLLRDTYGLPTRQAAIYGRLLVGDTIDPQPSFLQRLGLV